MENMIQRIAKVIAGCTYDGGGAVWDTLLDSEREIFEEAARMSIEAMLDPTEAMCEATDHICERTGDEIEIYQTFIKAALK